VWGDWALFQRLLTVLRRVGDRHGGASIANIAVRWVLDHPFVGAVLVGTVKKKVHFFVVVVEVDPTTITQKARVLAFQNILKIT
jgi:predicted oxidoreductase